MRIACLHTAESNIAVFESAARELGLPDGALRHRVRADLLAAAERSGTLTDEIASDTADELIELASDADAVVLTCSTLGPTVERLTRAGTPILRVDAALANEAVAAGGRIVALCAVETTLGPTARLFDEAAKATGATVEIRLVSGAWARFKSGDGAGYLAAIGDAANAAYDDGATLVVLAQASMAGAAELVTKGPRPPCSPTAGLAAAVALASGTRSVAQ